MYQSGAGLAVAEDTRLEHPLADGNPTGEHVAVDVAAGEYDIIRQSEVSPAMTPRVWSD